MAASNSPEVKKNRLGNIYYPSYEVQLEDYQHYVDGSLKIALKDLYGLCKDIKENFDDPSPDYPSELVEVIATIMDLIDGILYLSQDKHLIPLDAIPKHEEKVIPGEYQEGPALLDDYFATHTQSESDVIRLYQSEVSKENLAVEAAERQIRIGSKIDGILETKPALEYDEEIIKKIKAFAKTFEMDDVCKYYQEIIRRVEQSRKMNETAHADEAKLLVCLDEALDILTDDTPLTVDDIDDRIKAYIKGDSGDGKDLDETKKQLQKDTMLAYYNFIGFEDSANKGAGRSTQSDDRSKDETTKNVKRLEQNFEMLTTDTKDAKTNPDGTEVKPPGSSNPNIEKSAEEEIETSPRSKTGKPSDEEEEPEAGGNNTSNSDEEMSESDKPRSESDEHSDSEEDSSGEEDCEDEEDDSEINEAEEPESGEVKNELEGNKKGEEQKSSDNKEGEEQKKSKKGNKGRKSKSKRRKKKGKPKGIKKNQTNKK